MKFGRYRRRRKKAYRYEFPNSKNYWEKHMRRQYKIYPSSDDTENYLNSVVQQPSLSLVTTVANSSKIVTQIKETEAEQRKRLGLTDLAPEEKAKLEAFRASKKQKAKGSGNRAKMEANREKLAAERTRRAQTSVSSASSSGSTIVYDSPYSSNSSSSEPIPSRIFEVARNYNVSYSPIDFVDPSSTYEQYKKNLVLTQDIRPPMTPIVGIGAYKDSDDYNLNHSPFYGGVGKSDPLEASTRGKMRTGTHGSAKRKKSVVIDLTKNREILFEKHREVRRPGSMQIDSVPMTIDLNHPVAGDILSTTPKRVSRMTLKNIMGLPMDDLKKLRRRNMMTY